MDISMPVERETTLNYSSRIESGQKQQDEDTNESFVLVLDRRTWQPSNAEEF